MKFNSQKLKNVAVKRYTFVWGTYMGKLHCTRYIAETALEFAGVLFLRI